VTGIVVESGEFRIYGGVEGAGIGSGFGESGVSSVGTITIRNGIIYTKGGSHGAGIGTGYAQGGSSTVDKIVVNQGTIVAIGGTDGAGIGTGGGRVRGTAVVKSIVLEKGVFNVTAGTEAAGIGTGVAIEHGESTIGTITIENGEYYIRGDSLAAAIGTSPIPLGGEGTTSVDTITLRNGSFLANGRLGVGSVNRLNAHVGKIEFGGTDLVTIDCLVRGEQCAAATSVTLGSGKIEYITRSERFLAPSATVQTNSPVLYGQYRVASALERFATGSPVLQIGTIETSITGQRQISVSRPGNTVVRTLNADAVGVLVSLPTAGSYIVTVTGTGGSDSFGAYDVPSGTAYVEVATSGVSNASSGGSSGVVAGVVVAVIVVVALAVVGVIWAFRTRRFCWATGYTEADALSAEPIS
jgi:hypothetical protein